MFVTLLGSGWDLVRTSFAPRSDLVPKALFEGTLASECLVLLVWCLVLVLLLAVVGLVLLVLVLLVLLVLLLAVVGLVLLVLGAGATGAYTRHAFANIDIRSCKDCLQVEVAWDLS